MPASAPRIAIPIPHSGNKEYAEKAIPQYEHAVAMAGGEPVRISLDGTPTEVMKIVERCSGVLLPGSNADVDPAKFGAERSLHTAAPDWRRDAVDELLLQDAYNMRKPILGICYGLQSLNVYRSGSLVQHIPDFLPEHLRARVNHEAGKAIEVAHSVEIEEGSKLAEIVFGSRHPPSAEKSRGLILAVNSSHHQSAEKIGDGLHVTAHCAEDGVIEAVEGTARNHFVLAVQWHPERSVDGDEASRAIFRALIEAAKRKHQELESSLKV